MDYSLLAPTGAKAFTFLISLCAKLLQVIQTSYPLFNKTGTQMGTFFFSLLQNPLAGYRRAA